MNTEEKSKSGSKLEFDSNYDLRLVSNLSPALRWVLVLPIALLCLWFILHTISLLNLHYQTLMNTGL